MKKKKGLNIFFKAVLLTIVMVFSASALSGCMLLGLIGDPDELDIGGGDFDGLGADDEYGELEGLAGIKVCYRPQNYTEWEDLDKLNGTNGSVTPAFEQMADNVLNNLFYTYFIPTYESNYGTDIDLRGSYNLWNGYKTGGSNPKEITGLLYYINENTSNNINKATDSEVKNFQANFFERVRYETRVDKNVPQGENTITTVVENKKTADNKPTKVWNWTLPTTLEGLLSAFELERGVNAEELPAEHQFSPNLYFNKDTYNFESQQSLYNEYLEYYTTRYDLFRFAFVDTFSTALEINVYEIAIGRSPTAFNVDYETNPNGIPKIMMGGVDINAPENMVEGELPYLTQLKSDYQGFTSYVGLTDDARRQIKNLVSNVVIGEKAQQGVNPSVAKDVYFDGAVVNAIVEIAAQEVYIGGSINETDGGTNIEVESNVTDPYPAAMIMDYPATSFFMGMSETNPFRAMPVAEYQSFVLMPDRVDGLMSLWLAFRYDAGNDGDDAFIENVSLPITVSIRYYDSTTKTITEMAKDKIIVPDGAYEPMGESHLVMLDFEGYVGLVPFDNTIGNGILETGGKPKAVTGIRPPGGGFTLSDYYTLVPSETGAGGVGVLRSEKINHDYLEVLFDIEKDPYNVKKNCSFQVAITGYFQVDPDYLG